MSNGHGESVTPGWKGAPVFSAPPRVRISLGLCQVIKVLYVFDQAGVHLITA